jgi:outer membrane receptor for monomeric catechols
VAARPTLAQRRIQEFERRRHERRGVFITAEQMETSNANTLMDVLRSVPGVTLACTSRGCQVRMTRSARGGGCQPDWVLDGLPATWSSSPTMSTVGIVGIEIYRSLNETPAEFLKSDSQCGVIVIWTKSGP